MPDPARLSIITVTYNCRELLLNTIRSIREQSYPHIEYIVVDGASDDGTKAVIEKEKETITAWISEPDHGIYDAMNKGLAMASGDYVWFINAGDEIHAPDTVERIFKEHQPADLYYGDAMITDSDGKEIGLRRLRPPEALTWKDFRWGQLVSHQSFISKRELAPDYDLQFRHSADIDWQLKILRRAETIVNTHQVLCNFLDGGHSKQHIPVSLRERFQIMKKNYGLLRSMGNHFIIGIKFFIYLFRHRRF